jgi:Type VI secretion system/phage-baseplate injector OB domain
MNGLWGKYRGAVVDDRDPLQMGRLKVLVPSVLGEVASSWAMPCAPYPAPRMGLAMLPPPGAGVWIEFEGGDPEHPIWSGCFWREGEWPMEAATPDAPEPDA